MAGNTATPGASVTGRVLAVLGAFDEAHPALTLTELAGRAALPVPTAHRLLGELARGGAVERRADGRYVIGPRIWDLGLLAPGRRGLRQVAAPLMNDFYAATLALVHLAERDGTSAHYLDVVSGRQTVPIVSQAGSRLPLHATGVGKVLLAHAPDDVQEQVLGSLVRVTPFTITAPGRLREQLRRVRRDGFAWTAEEMSLGACSVAVPIRSGGEVIASVGVVVPSLGGSRRRMLVTALEVTAQGIARGLDRGAADPGDW